MSSAAPSAAPDPKLLAILVCPMTRASLRYDAAANELVADKAGLAYPIRDGVPIMLIEAAREFVPVE
ncbi:Trm112 family protein [Sandarakinorhabdus sp.]|uniref:Trm112 family protein n=1 Tax=Sandarakinorhabdus sp. TaxID=1916663 RepID=UPI00286D75B2|nr:Trm112 family protein [Sandarakinorhabdus sp.]